MIEPTVLADVVRVAAGFVLLLGTGLLVAGAWGARGYSLVLAAAPTSFALTGILAVVQTKAPFAWRPLPIAAIIIGLAGIGVLWGRRRGGRRPIGATPWWVVGVLAALTLVVAGTLLAACGGTFLTVSQTWDAAFHTNAIRGIYEFGEASPLRLRTLSAGGDGVGSFYPATFAPFAAFFGQAVGAAPVPAANLAAVLMGGAVWPSSVAVLARTVLRPDAKVTGVALALSLGVSGMPWSPLGFGVLWSSMAAFAVAPLYLAAAVRCVRPLLDGHPFDRRAGLETLGAAALVMLCHPRVLLITTMFVALAVVVLLLTALSRSRRQADGATTRRGGWSLVAIAVLSGAALVYSRRLMDPKFQYVDWPVVESVHGIVLRAIVNAPMRPYPGFLVGTLVLVGVAVTAKSRRLRWLPVCWFAAILLEAVTALSRNNYALAVTRFWYADRYRVVPALPLFSVVLAVVGSGWVLARLRARWLSRAERSGGGSRRPTRRLLVPIALVGALAYLLVVVNVPQRLEYLDGYYADGSRDPHVSLVSPTDLAFYTRIADAVPADALILNNPQDGSAFIYAYTGRRVTFPSPTYNNDPIASWIRLRLVPLRDHALVCKYLSDGGITHVFNGGATLSTDMFQPTPAPGMQVPDGFWATTPVLVEGDLRLYKITGCDGPRPLR